MSWLFEFTDNRYGLDPEFWDRLQGLQKKVGGEQQLRVFDGYRSVAEQDRRRAFMEQSGKNPDEYYATPGQSSHNYGLGADLIGDLQAAQQYAPNYGLYMPMKQDPWHIEPSYVTQMGLPQDDVTAAEASIASDFRQGNVSEDLVLQAMRVHAQNEAQAERFNRVEDSSLANKSLIDADTAGTRTGQPSADSQEAQLSGAVRKLNEQKAVDDFNAAQLGGAMQAMGQTPAVGIKPGPNGQGWQNIDAFLMTNGIKISPPTKGQTDGGTHAAGSYHYQGTARDYGTNGSDPQAIYNALVGLAADPNGPIAELFWEGGSGSDWKNGRNIGRTIGGHGDHVHVALKPGRSLSETGGGATQAAGGYQRMTLQEAALDPAFMIAQIADLHARGAEKSYARSVPLRPLGEQAGKTDTLKQVQSGQVEGQTEVLAPDEHKTAAGRTEIAVAAQEGRPIHTENAPPQPLIEDLQLQASAAQGGGGDMDSLIRQGMQQMGVSPDNFDAIKHRMMVESGGRNIQQQIKDVNSGGNEAFGPFQFTKGTFDRFAVPGATDWHNPYHQVLAYINAVRTSRKYGGNFRHPSLMGKGGWSP